MYNRLQYQKATCHVSALARLFIVSVVLILAMGLAVSAQAVSSDSAAMGKSLIVKLVKGLTEDEHAAIIARNGGVEKLDIPALQVHVVECPAKDLSEIIANYLTDAQVAGVEIK
jgi:hypothetical protein